jgi:hypothetical protein
MASGSTPAVSTATTIVQVITFSFSLADYTGLRKTLCEKGYGKSIGIFDTSTNAYVAGAAVSSTAAAARRATAVTFTATVPQAYAANATTASQSLNATSLQNAIAAVKAADSTYSSIALPNVTNVATPTITAPSSGGTTTGGAASTTTSGTSRVDVGFAGFALAVLVAGMSRH